MKKIAIVCLALALGCSEEEGAAEAAEATEAPAPEPEPAFEYTESPTAESIPNSPAMANANGREIEIKTVVFQPRFNSWSMTLTTAELDRPTGILPAGAESINLTDLPQELAAGTFTHSIDESGGGYFQIKKIDDPESTTSWNTRLAYVLEITEWNGQPYDPEGRLFQEAGTASGKVVAVFRGREGGFANSWVAGTFEDATVRYMGKPRWLEEEEDSE
ncbi:MAG: hypothetical protein AAGE52_15530 [Myxococcota bacterium]